jgi:Zn-dependent M28 family amino/carboxypeptidase
MPIPGAVLSSSQYGGRQALIDQLQADVHTLAADIGERNTACFENLQRAASFIRTSMQSSGLAVSRYTYEINSRPYDNLEVEMAGTTGRDEIIVIGAHYDSIRGGPGANDNGSGVAALLALARLFAHDRFGCTVRFVFFVNEEPPYVRTSKMGSLVYARGCRRRGKRIVAMLSLETIGYFPGLDPPAMDPWPVRTLLRPFQGNFLAVIGNRPSRRLVRDVARWLREGGPVPVMPASLPGSLPGVKSSDHWSFWQCGYPALMLTDTAPFRYPFYHTTHDTPDKLSYRALADVVIGLRHAIASLSDTVSGINVPTSYAKHR